MDYRTNEIRTAALIYANAMSNIHQRRLLLDKEEIDAYRELTLAINADNPELISQLFRPHYEDLAQGNDQEI